MSIFERWTRSSVSAVAPTLTCRREPSDDGYVAVEALFAVFILAVSIGFALEAFYQARQAESLALEFRLARNLAEASLAAPPRRHPSTSAGVAGGLPWRRDITLSARLGLMTICHNRVEVQGRTSGAKRRYVVSTLEPCKPEPDDV